MEKAGTVIIIIILSISQYLLRRWIVGAEAKDELPRAGKRVDLWGKVILLLIAMIWAVNLIVEDRLTDDIFKWFMIAIIVLATGFQAFVDWKYRKSSKEYIVSLIVLVMGVVLVCLLL
ncbi:DUF4181 domain-containing protein [Paenibacillus sp. YPG26]|uniref:DUF4181 domain-containing protein n=1 Tax=Paenibacillus sp. YPG26 TaxID=2878915 RepID=UPI00203D2B4F|nr:DUF4181 domain-containing protein [Paenibacillus sp. YPG26]USB33062.1 DUF4181 domain-containing protein [Paenibacillus sp. YPG26]